MITLFLLFKLLSRIRIKPARRRRTVTNRTVTKTVYTLGTKTGPARTSQRSADRIQADRAKAEREAARKRREQFKRSQAAADLIHYMQVKADLLKAYDAAGIEGDTEKAIRRRIAYDNFLRRVEKQIEKSAYDARTGL